MEWLQGLASLLALLGVWPNETGEVGVAFSKPVSAETVCAEWTPVGGGEQIGPSCGAIERRRATLLAPVGRWDMRVVVEGYAPIYRWDVVVGAGDRLDLGLVEPIAGASVAGWIRGLDLESDGDAPVVELVLRRKVFGWLGDPEQRRKVERLEVVATPRADGFFQVAGAAAGTHELMARFGVGGSQVLADVELAAGESVAFDAPFDLEAPAPIEVYIDPPVDGVGEAWAVELRRQVPKSRVLETVDRGSANDAGAWTSRPLPAGIYDLEVTDSGGSEWANRTVEVDVTTSFVEVALDLRPIRGTLHLGDEPLAAEIVFGTMNRRPRIVLQSNEDGGFVGALPKAGEWPIDVVVDDEILSAEPVVIDPDDDVAEVEIVLPNTTLTGTVTRAGAAVAGAIVIVRRAEDRQQIATARTAADGRFRWRGLAVGEVGVSALHGRDTSDWTLTQLADEAEIDIELVIEARRSVRGQLRFQGAPVAGAQIDYRVGGSSFMPHPTRAVSDLDGRFELAVPEGQQQVELHVQAPSAGVHIARFDLRTTTSDPVVELPSWDLPETIALRLPINRQILEQGDSRLIRANGASIEASVLFNTALTLGTLTSVDNAFWIGGLGASHYQICDGPNGPCMPAETAPTAPPAEPVVPRSAPVD